MGKHAVSLIIILVFSFVGMKALFHPDLFTAHDIWHQVARLYHYQSAAFGGEFPPYWISNLSNGFGYPLFFFSYHLPWILGLPFLWIGLSIPVTIKILFVLSYLLSGIFMYSLAFGILKSRMMGLLTGILYLWAPYRFLTILVGAAMGTAFVFVFFPILIWGIYTSISRDKRVLGIILTAIGTSGIILSHLMTAFAVAPIVFLFSVWAATQVKDTRQFLKNITVGIVLGLGISSFYLFPAVYYSGETQVSTGGFAQNYQHNFVNLNQLVYSKWGYGLFKESAKEGANSYQVGIAQWISVVLLSLFLITKKRVPRPLKSLGILLMTGFTLSILAMLDVSQPVWNFVNKFITLDYPTMFLLPAVFIGSFVAGAVLISFEKKFRFLVVAALLSIALYTNRNHLRVNMYIDMPVSLVVSSEITTTSFHEYLPKMADIKFFSEENILVALPTSNFYQDANKLSFSVLAPEDMEISIRQFAFPGLTLYLDSKKLKFTKDERGRIKFAIPSDWHNILVKFEETSIIRIGKLTTLISILILIALGGSMHAKKA